MRAVPTPIPDTMPDVSPTIAMPGLLLVHVPPATEELSAELLPRHKLVLPEITARGKTITFMLDVQPAGVV